MREQAEGFLYPDMTIVLPGSERRRFSYGDNRSGFLELFSGQGAAARGQRGERAAEAEQGAGYVSSGICLFRDFGLFLSTGRETAFVSRAESTRTEVGPEGFVSHLPLPSGGEAVVSVSLLSGRRALSFSVGLPAGSGEAELALFIPKERSPEAKDASLSFAASAEAGAKASRIALREASGDVEKAAKGDLGCRAWRLSPASGWEGATAYLAFPSDGRKAEDEAASCASAGALRAHRAFIFELLSRARLNTGNADFDAALRWCIASGWSLVTDEYGRGIWAGLPWFRDNWGRDTFIALPGILLATGRFTEAREVLLGFSRWQKTDPSDPEYGRIPNRFSDPAHIIYNTADGTPWFIRESLEYLEYTGDYSFARQILPVVERAIEADCERLDASGFLRHGPADTWMDAKIEGKLPWSARGDRAVDIQALWYTALISGARIAEIAGEGQSSAAAKASEWRALAARVRDSFLGAFWKKDEGIMADRLSPEEEGGKADYRNRPNQLFVSSVPAVLDDGKRRADSAFVPEAVEDAATVRAVSRLLYPYGMASLDQEDPLFHPAHEDPEHYHKDAAYHNGTVWLWNSGPAIEALCRGGREDLAWRHSLELAAQVLRSGCAGTLSENLHALPGPDGRVVRSGTWSQAWSVAEYTRTAFQCYLGFRPRLLSETLILEPSLPASLGSVTARLPFGRGNSLEVGLFRSDARLVCTVLWKPLSAESAYAPALTLFFRPRGKGGRWEFALTIKPEVELRLEFDEATGALSVGGAASVRGALVRKSALPASLDFAVPRLPDWNPASRFKDSLKRLIEAGRYDLGPRAALEESFSSAEYAKAYHFDGQLGCLWSPERSIFRLWAPTAESVVLSVYPSGDGSEALAVLPMERGERGVWSAVIEGNLDGRYYDYLVRVHGRTKRACDPYARSAGLNGRRAMVLDFSRTDPEGWAGVSAPALESPADAVIEEVHVADITSHPSWRGNEAIRRSYAGAGQRGTTWSPGAGQDAIPTGLDHFASLGVTHLQLLPIFDYDTVDEGRVRDPSYRSLKFAGAFNWGYDPGNYSVPEGSYSVDPRDGASRVRELKLLVSSIVGAGMGVIMDVVFNHMPDIDRSCLEACVPGYYFRAQDFSGAGPDTASERTMFRAFMIDSLSWWLRSYKLSGFRFDLMGLHDVQTMRDIERALKEIKPDVLLYGEGWDMYQGTAMSGASMVRAGEIGRIGMFNDAFRNGLKGNTFDAHDPGWLHDGRDAESVKFGLVGAVRHPQVHPAKVKGTVNPHPWSEDPWRSISYTEIHDNLTLHDKLVLVEPEASAERIVRQVRMALTLILCSEGMPILHSGMEFLRTKEFPREWVLSGGLRKEQYSKDGKRAFCHDSFSTSDEVNALDWTRAWTHRDTVSYVRGLVALRKAHPLFRLRSGDEVRRRLKFLDEAPSALAWKLDGEGSADPWKGILVAGNAGKESLKLKLPAGAWAVVADGYTIAPEGKGSHSGSFDLPAETVAILRQL